MKKDDNQEQPPEFSETLPEPEEQPLPGLPGNELADIPRVPTGDFRKEMAELLNRAAYGRERFILQRKGKDIAAMVPLEDLSFLRMMEDWFDEALEKEALAEDEGLSWD